MDLNRLSIDWNRLRFDLNRLRLYVRRLCECVSQGHCNTIMPLEPTCKNDGIKFNYRFCVVTMKVNVNAVNELQSLLLCTMTWSSFENYIRLLAKTKQVCPRIALQIGTDITCSVAAQVF